MIRHALLSVWDKEGIVELAKYLDKKNIKIISTGGTKRLLEKANLKIKSVSELTDQRPVMNGRVKTLHPTIFGGILADRNNQSHMNDLQLLDSMEIDLVVVNLYPFKEEAVNKKLELQKAIEFIDIGGPSMLRASAKNYLSVVPLCRVEQYQDFINLYNESNGNISEKDRLNYAKEVFRIMQEYDNSIFNYFNSDCVPEFPSIISHSYKLQNELRYGENPHQKAAYYSSGNHSGWKQLSGKKLSYNNYMDMESAYSIISEFEDPGCCIVKHSNPCGFSLGINTIDAFNSAIECDPISYFGGIVSFNRAVDKELAKILVTPFLECIIAPKFEKGAIHILSNKKNLRLVEYEEDFSLPSNLVRTSMNGLLVQTRDIGVVDYSDLDVVTKRKPSKNEVNAMRLGWKLVKFVKSNAIVFANEKQLLGIGAGQTSRVDSVKIAIRKVSETKLNLNNSVMASDAFFPFSDCVKLASESGVRAIIQPGGSIKDQDVIDEANRLGLSMVFTGQRHFFH